MKIPLILKLDKISVNRMIAHSCTVAPQYGCYGNFNMQNIQQIV